MDLVIACTTPTPGVVKATKTATVAPISPTVVTENEDYGQFFTGLVQERLTSYMVDGTYQVLVHQEVSPDKLDLVTKTLQIFDEYYRTRDSIKISDTLTLTLSVTDKQSMLVLVDRSKNLPPSLLKRGEVTKEEMTFNYKVHIVSFVNLLDTVTPEYSLVSSVAQAVCFRYAQHDQNKDAKCNLITAVASAAFTGSTREDTIAWLSGRKTEVGHLSNSADYEFIFNQDIWDYFSSRKIK